MEDIKLSEYIPIPNQNNSYFEPKGFVLVDAPITEQEAETIKKFKIGFDHIIILANKKEEEFDAEFKELEGKYKEIFHIDDHIIGPKISLIDYSNGYNSTEIEIRKEIDPF